MLQYLGLEVDLRIPDPQILQLDRDSLSGVQVLAWSAGRTFEDLRE